MTLWRIPIREYRQRLGADLQRMLMVQHDTRQDDLVDQVVPLRDIVEIHRITPLKHEFVWRLLQRVSTTDNQFPFASCSKMDMNLVSMDPRLLKVGQRFVYREKYTSLLEHVPVLFRGHWLAKGGIHTLGAYSIVGEDKEGETSLAFYLPPIIERHGHDFVLMDGIHRNFICHQHGTTTSALIVNNVSVPFPCEAMPWSSTNVIPLTERPQNVEDRFFGLTPAHMRNLKFLGIDG